MNSIIAIHKKYADLIFEGKKTIEIRRKEPGYHCDRIFLYETKKSGGLGMIVGEIVPDYRRALQGTMYKTPAGMSDEMVAQTCLSRDELETYAGGPYKTIYALKIKKAVKYKKPVRIARGGPQSWMYSNYWEDEKIDRENH